MQECCTNGSLIHKDEHFEVWHCSKLRELFSVEVFAEGEIRLWSHIEPVLFYSAAEHPKQWGVGSWIASRQESMIDLCTKLRAMGFVRKW